MILARSQYTRSYTCLAQTIKNPPAMQKTQVQSLSGEDALEEGMAIRSSVLAWEIP